jgi:hypothetical protein
MTADEPVPPGGQGPAEVAGQPGRAPLLTLTAEDKKLLVITIAGTIIGAVGAAAIIGIAIALARVVKSDTNPGFEWAWIAIALLAGSVVLRRTWRQASAARGFWRMLAWATALLGAVLLLAVIGLAAGIH